MERSTIVWGLLLSAILVFMFCSVYGNRLGFITAVIFLASFWLLLWALHREDPGRKK